MENIREMILHDKLRCLVDEIEEITKAPIRLRKRTPDDLLLVSDAALPLFDCNMVEGKMDVSIALPAECQMTEHTLYHELLHAHRYICLTVPRLTPKRNDLAGFRLAAGIDNDVEHLFIIPQETHFSAAAFDYWHQHYNEILSGLAAESPVNPMEILARRNSLLRLWMVTSTCLPNWGGALAAKAVLASSGYTFEAEKLLSKVKLELPSKINCLTAVFRFSKLPSEFFCTSRFLVAEGRIEYAPLPQRQ